MQEPLFDSGDVVDAAMLELQKTPGWPFDPSKDRLLLNDLRDSYPQLDLIEEIRAWRAWMLDHETKKKVKPRARLRTWCSKAIEFRRGGGRPSSGSGGGGSPQAPEPPSAFGTGPVRLDDW